MKITNKWAPGKNGTTAYYKGMGYSDLIMVNDDGTIHSNRHGDLMVYWLKPGNAIRFDMFDLKLSLDANTGTYYPIVVYEKQPDKLFEGLNDADPIYFVDKDGEPLMKYGRAVRPKVWDKQVVDGFKNVETFLKAMESLDIFRVLKKTRFKYNQSEYFGHRAGYLGKAGMDARAGRFGEKCTQNTDLKYIADPMVDLQK